MHGLRRHQQIIKAVVLILDDREGDGRSAGVARKGGEDEVHSPAAKKVTVIVLSGVCKGRISRD